MIEIETRRGEAGLYSPVGHPGAAAGRDRSDGPSHVAFWLRPVSLFGRFGVTSPASLHVLQPSTSPLAALRLEAGRAPTLSPELHTLGHPAACPGRAPKHHRVRPGFPTGTQTSTLATFPTRVRSKVENVSGRAPLPPPRRRTVTLSLPGDRPAEAHGIRDLWRAAVDLAPLRPGALLRGCSLRPFGTPSES